MSIFQQRLLLPAVLLACLACWQLTVGAQPKSNQKEGGLESAKPGTRFEFQIVESFDSKYLGDTPGHIGHAGGLGSTRPNVALGDSIYRGETVVGKVSTVVWSPVKGSLTIEFDPTPDARLAVGEVVAVDLNPASPPQKRDE